MNAHCTAWDLLMGDVKQITWTTWVHIIFGSSTTQSKICTPHLKAVRQLCQRGSLWTEDQTAFTLIIVPLAHLLCLPLGALCNLHHRTLISTCITKQLCQSCFVGPVYTKSSGGKQHFSCILSVYTAMAKMEQYKNEFQSLKI